MQILGYFFSLLTSSLFTELFSQILVAATTFAFACAEMLRYLFPAQ